MTSDLDLLEKFARSHSQDAFTELVKRHVNLVYSAALRQVRSPQLAEEIAQSVFADLARVAATPSSPACVGRDASPPQTLTPWLYAVTRRTAVDVIRKESRRQLREQIAVEMNAMNAAAASGTGVPPVWSDIEQHLEDAMAALDETDRATILLRYFENKSLREVGETLGTNEDAAQKRVSRAVERLREFFSKRNVTIGASGLAVLISANAVQSAPIGLAATISAAAVLAGTAVSTSTTITTTKIIAMTTLQKSIIGAAVVAVVGTGIFEAHQVSQLRDQNQNFQQQQTSLSGQIQESQRERDDATNQLASLLAENEQSKSHSNEIELLKLRGQVGALRQQLAFMQAKMNLPASGLEKIMADPATKELADQQARREIKLRYADLFRELKLSPEQIEKFALAYANSGLEQTDVEGQLRSLLGDDGYAQFKEFTQEIPARTTVKFLNSQLGVSQLTDEQDVQLLQVVKAEPYDLTYGIEGDLNEAFFGTQDQVDNYVRQVATSNQHVVQQAGAFLTPDQLAGLNTLLTNSLNMRIAQAAALVQKH